MKVNSTVVRGRALCIGTNGRFYVARGYSVFRFTEEAANGSWTLDCWIPQPGWKAAAARRSASVARLLRLNLQALQVLPDGARVVIARDGIYRAEPGSGELRRTWSVTRGSRPINLSIDGNRVLFGEYGGAELKKAGVRIYCSDDGGRRFESVHEFPKGDINHIHNVVVDPYANHYWVLTGDHGRAPGIGALSKDFRSYDWVDRGSQVVRAVRVLARPDCLIYGSDSEVEPNFVIRLDRRTGRCDKVAPLDGSSLYAADFGPLSLISTCVEPSAVNTGREASVYASHDGENWSRQFSAHKDPWPAVLFQMGTIVFPYVHSPQLACGMFSGQALSQLHDRVRFFTCDNSHTVSST